MTRKAERAATRPAYVAKLVVFPGTPCHACDHPRSSHSEIVLQAPCKVTDCPCKCFEPICGCGHLLCEHTWGTSSDPWACAMCNCGKFGADMSGDQPHESPVAPTVPPSRPAPKPYTPPEVHEERTHYGQVCRWGRRDLALYDCAQVPCPDRATYWTTRAYYGRAGKLVTVKGAYCGRHFRQWSAKWLPPTQLSLFSAENNPQAS